MTLTLPVGKKNVWLGTFGERWVQTMCAVAGCAAAKPEPDMFGDDLIVRNAEGEVIRVQVKTTEAVVPAAGTLPFALDVATYDKLRQGSTLAYLVVVTVIRRHPDWTRHYAQIASVRAVAHWLRLTGLPATANTTTICLSIPTGNILTPATLASLFV